MRATPSCCTLLLIALAIILSSPVNAQTTYYGPGVTVTGVVVMNNRAGHIVDGVVVDCADGYVYAYDYLYRTLAGLSASWDAGGGTLAIRGWASSRRSRISSTAANGARLRRHGKPARSAGGTAPP